MGDVMTKRRQLQMMKESKQELNKRRFREKQEREKRNKKTGIINFIGDILKTPYYIRGGERKSKGGLSTGQAKIAAKAPPFNKIDGKDFAVLRKEKAKGRGKGLQDEKMKPGKMMKAKQGILAKLLGGKKKMIVITGMKPQDRYGQQFKPTPIKPKKKMGGGMMMRPRMMQAKKGILVKTKLGKNRPTKMY